MEIRNPELNAQSCPREFGSLFLNGGNNPSVHDKRESQRWVKRSIFTRTGLLLLARISHQWSAAAPDPSVRTALRLVVLLDVLSGTPRSPSRHAPSPDGVSDASLRQLVRKAG